MKKSAAGVLALLILAAPAQAQDDGAGFPDPQCTKPDLGSITVPKFTNVGGVNDSGPVGSYNSKIKAYNKAAEAYNSCIRAYVDSANLETRKIQDQANAEVKRITANANAAMSTIHAKVDKAVSEANQVSQAQNASNAALRGP